MLEFLAQFFLFHRKTPARNILKKLVNDVNKSPEIESITISGSVMSSKDVNRSHLNGAFRQGLYKLLPILKRLGLNKDVKVNIGDTKAKNNGENKIKIQFKFN